MKENSEDVQTSSYETKDDGRYETANKEERENVMNLGDFFKKYITD